MTFDPNLYRTTTVDGIIVLEWTAGTDINTAMQYAWKLHIKARAAVLFTFNGSLISFGGTRYV